MRLEMFFNQYIQDLPFRTLAVDLSEHGLAAQRLTDKQWTRSRVVGIELELPGTGEIVWAKAETQFEAIDRHFHRAGLRFVAMARRHERLIRDYVREKRIERYAWWQRVSRLAT